MPKHLRNPARGKPLFADQPLPKSDPSAVETLLAQCPKHAETSLLSAQALAQACGVAAVFIKDERARMELGSFKALGAAFVIARDAVCASKGAEPGRDALAGHVYVAASAGNHGLSVAAGASVFGARAIIYLAQSVPEAFAQRLRAMGAEVVRAGAQYEASMEAAASDAAAKGWTLLSDSSWDGYLDIPHGVMEGYLQMAAECVRQIPQPPTHILLQAGVGGLAAAVAAHARAVWGDTPQIIVVEPEAAPALIESIRAQTVTTTQGPVSDMGRLDCKTPSVIALNGLARDADLFVTLTESEAAQGVEVLRGEGLASTPSGAAGLAALIAGLPGLDAASRVLTILSEGPEDA